ncbi:MAG: hypothetical protein D6729_02335, partial [Deltaproteobacteria bacterium]
MHGSSRARYAAALALCFACSGGCTRDFTVPAEGVVIERVDVSPERVGATGRLEIEVVAHGAEEVTVLVGSRPAHLDGQSGSTYRFTYFPNRNEPEGEAVPVEARASRGPATAFQSATVSFDFTPPELTEVDAPAVILAIGDTFE